MQITKKQLKKIILQELNQVVLENTDPVNLLTNVLASVEAELKATASALQNGDTQSAMSNIEGALGQIEDVKGTMDWDDGGGEPMQLPDRAGFP